MEKRAVSDEGKIVTTLTSILSNELFQNDKILLKSVSETMNKTQDYIMRIIEEGQRGHLLRRDISAQSLSIVLIDPF